ncbi:MAG: heme A synthase [Deltaproteobacteria bacterium]|nr:heme A synthase [Deltaproteobacteria bacterium]
MLGRATVGLLFLLLVWGNLVAGLKAGLACPDWPLCHGKVLPPLRWDIYMEFLHRVIAGIASIFLVALSLRRYRRYDGAARLIPVMALLLLLAEVAMGGAVVLLEIPVQLTTVHFMTGLLVFLLAFCMMTFDGEYRRVSLPFRGSAAVFLCLAALVYSQASLGAYVRHLGAGLACPDFPTCLGRWIPPLFSWPVLAHFSHRLVAGLILLTAVSLYLFVRKDARQRGNRGLALSFLLLSVVQIAVGATVVLTRLHFAAAALHLAVALGMLVVLGHLWVNAVRAEGSALSLPPL